jgi:hypothetical protein
MNILFAGLGGYVAGTGAGPIIARVHGCPGAPYVRQAYFVLALVDLGCLLLLTVGGVYLLRLNRLGLRICNLVFPVEIGWFLAGSCVPLALGMSGGKWASLGRSIAAAGGIGSLGSAPQILVGYPVFALIFLNLARGGFPNSAPQA